MSRTRFFGAVFFQKMFEMFTRYFFEHVLIVHLIRKNKSRRFIIQRAYAIVFLGEQTTIVTMIIEQKQAEKKGLRISVFLILQKMLRSLAIRVLPKEIEPRAFSNMLLRKYAIHFGGDIINVSGWDDRDSEGDYYQNYFRGHKRYVVSNVGISDKGFGSLLGKNVAEIEIDLEQPLPVNCVGAFDVVFNHTTLEHIFEFDTAFKNLCDMSKDAVVIVVPLLQQIHIAGSFGDYWRPTTLAMMKLFKKNGFTPLVVATNDQPFFPVYCFAIAVRDPQKYEGKITPTFDFQSGGTLFGSSLKPAALEKLLAQMK